MKIHNPRLKQELIKAQYQSNMIVAIDMLQDPNTDMVTVERRTANMLASDKLTTEEKDELQKEWIPNARLIAEFNEAPEYICDDCKKPSFTNDCKQWKKNSRSAALILCPECYSKR